uniref:Uncharacterized protein n=1 Tax=Zea mays TaxID=4577 RepID=B4FHK9_MAIZE|nr:unknown [Zea mays]
MGRCGSLVSECAGSLQCGRKMRWGAVGSGTGWMVFLAMVMVYTVDLCSMAGSQRFLENES